MSNFDKICERHAKVEKLRGFSGLAMSTAQADRGELIAMVKAAVQDLSDSKFDVSVLEGNLSVQTAELQAKLDAAVDKLIDVETGYAATFTELNAKLDAANSMNEWLKASVTSKNIERLQAKLKAAEKSLASTELKRSILYTGHGELLELCEQQKATSERVRDAFQYIPCAEHDEVCPRSCCHRIIKQALETES